LSYPPQAYNGEKKDFEGVPADAKKQFNYTETKNEPDFPKLKCLDVFAGCGGRVIMSYVTF